jgi:hypothetical protein
LTRHHRRRHPTSSISRVRPIEAALLERENIDLPPACKIAQTKHVGCMRLFGGNRSFGKTYKS